MSEKAQMKYKAVPMRNPRTGETFLRPVVTERSTIGLKGLVEYAKTAGYVRGQTKDLEGLLGGFIQAMQDRAKAGHSINVNDWFIISGQLKGRVGENQQLTAANSYHVTITASKDLKVGIDEFAWTNVGDTGAAPKLTGLASVGSAADGRLVKSAAFVATGANIYLNDGDAATLSWLGEDDEPMSITVTPSEKTTTSLKFAWPSTLDAVAAGTEVTLTLKLYGGASGASGAGSGVAKTATRKAKVAAA